MLTITINSHGDIQLALEDRSVTLVEPAPCLVEACAKPEAQGMLMMVAETMAETTRPSIPAAFVERVLRNQGVIAA